MLLHRALKQFIMQIYHSGKKVERILREYPLSGLQVLDLILDWQTHLLRVVRS